MKYVSSWVSWGGRLTLSVSSLSRRKYLLDQGYLIKRTKNSIPDCISFHIYGSGQDRQNGLLNSHMIPTRDIGNIFSVKSVFRNLLTTWWSDGCRLSGGCNERDCRRSGMIFRRIMSCETWHNSAPQLISVSGSGPVSNDNVNVWDGRV